MGDLDRRARKGELEGVSLSRLLEGVAAISMPLTHEESRGRAVKECKSPGVIEMVVTSSSEGEEEVVKAVVVVVVVRE